MAQREVNFSGDAGMARDEGFINRVRSVLGLPHTTLVELTNASTGKRGGYVIEYAITRPVQLKGSEFGIAEGVTVDEHASAKLEFDKSGRLISSRLFPPDERELRLVRDQVKKLVHTGQIEPIRLAAQGKTTKPWYIAEDSQGTRRLKRAHFS